MKGRIHSIESCGTVDGPGLRCVIFFQGCLLRCRYCHNPDTWNPKGGQKIDSAEIISKVLRFKPYFKHQGGITLSGGEPLLQPEFAAEILQCCQNAGVHTAIDTSGWVDRRALEKVLPFTDLLLLDIKALDSPLYQWITGKPQEPFSLALEYIKASKVPLWLRYVVLPGINDSALHMQKLKKFVHALENQVEKVELLPYHPLGVHKWQKLNLVYTLGHLSPPTEDAMQRLHEEMKQSRIFSTA
ncbi:pyruvate formate-lyase-activating protein [Desulforamulus ruminis]|uniref:Pyruvate formate-lyase-activating enzyme n=1 Tax=Desulforamulus ruminis (strain ATCC 23193 / DSM 2154 / NCIMB 8452 / DL) TaxID=696281 RepID=F6DKN0_DESRL|nr:pyruvate formate-lyase-activating protein [Desulforamulus ruminis]AEG60405.1 pyruvate formate-lyase activating enzyme [Desulforamulus ruminis DSM 2154]